MQTVNLPQPPWLVHAWAELGQRELPGARSNPRIVDYIRRSGHPEMADEATPWCAAFVGACLDRAGISGSGSLLARSYLDWGRHAEPAEAGAIAVLSRGSDPRFGHVGFLVGATAEHVLLLGGNQSDAVTVEAFAITRLLGLRLPAGDRPRPPIAGDSDAAFAWSLARILEHEGGYSDDPFDPGGPTNKGITLAIYARRTNASVTAASYERLKAELRSIPDALVGDIYRDQYWVPARCDRLPGSLAHFHFDAAVNQGVTGAARMLQEALGVDIDGDIGPLTIAAAAHQPAAEILVRYAEIRRARYRALHHFWRFGRGWLSRVDRTLAQSLGLITASRSASPPPAPAPLAPPRPEFSSDHEDTKDMPDSSSPLPTPTPTTDAKWWGNSLTVWGALVTGVATVAPTLLAAFGLDVPGALIERLGSDLVIVAQALGGLAGTVMTILGRARAVAPLQRKAVAIRL